MAFSDERKRWGWRLHLFRTRVLDLHQRKRFRNVSSAARSLGQASTIRRGNLDLSPFAGATQGDALRDAIDVLSKPVREELYTLMRIDGVLLVIGQRFLAGGPAGLSALQWHRVSMRPRCSARGRDRRRTGRGCRPA